MILAFNPGDYIHTDVSNARAVGPNLEGEPAPKCIPDDMYTRLVREGTPCPPFITGLGSTDTAVTLLKNGAADYITKPFDLAVGKSRGSTSRCGYDVSKAYRSVSWYKAAQGLQPCIETDHAGAAGATRRTHFLVSESAPVQSVA